jgi:hypothetical protein
MFRRHSTLILSLLLMTLTIAAFWQVKDHQFVDLDDVSFIVENSQINHGLSLTGVKWAFATIHGSNYWHPVTWLSHMLDCQLFGLSPRGHHWMNLFFHLANVLLVFLVLRRMTGALWESALAAALFAVHPLRVESVAWVAERKDLLGAFFGLLTMGAYLGYAARRTWGSYLLVAACFTLGLMAKPMLVTLPVALLLLDYWPLGRLPLEMPGSGLGSTFWGFLKNLFSRRGVHLLGEKGPLLCLAAVFIAINLSVQKGGKALTSFDILPLSARIANALVSYVSYIYKFIWPFSLSAFYPHPMTALPGWEAAGAGLILAGVSVGVILRNSRSPYLATGWFWYLGTLMPVIGLTQMGKQGLADRFTYMPLLGLIIMAVWGMFELAGRLPYRRLVLTLSAAIMLSVCLVGTWFQVGYWRDSMTVFQHMLKLDKNNYMGYYGVGLSRGKKGDTAGAVAMYLKALEINPGYQEIYNSLGNAYVQLGDIDKAAECFQKALSIDPNFGEAYNNLGIILGQKGRIAEAMAMFERAIQINPLSARAYYNLGNAYAIRGNTREAMEMYQRSLQIDPNFTKAQNRLKVLNKTDKLN